MTIGLFILWIYDLFDSANGVVLPSSSILGHFEPAQVHLMHCLQLLVFLSLSLSNPFYLRRGSALSRAVLHQPPDTHSHPQYRSHIAIVMSVYFELVLEDNKDRNDFGQLHFLKETTPLTYHMEWIEVIERPGVLI